MELSDDVRKGLGAVADPKRFPPAQLSALVSGTVECLTSGREAAALFSANAALSRMDGGLLRGAHAAVATLLLEAARLLIDEDVFGSTLAELGFAGKQSELVATAYQSHRDALRAVLARNSFHYPHVVDVQWRLDYYIKSAKVEKVDEFQWVVTLKTMDKGEIKDVTFTCNREEMQELLFKLKDALAVVERLQAD